jgi:hypothetical protein
MPNNYSPLKHNIRSTWQIQDMAAPLEPKLAELLIRLVEMDDGNYETFIPHFPGNGPLNEALLLNHRDQTIPEGATKELADRGYLDMEFSTKRLGKFRISEAGRALAAQLASERDGAVDLSWPTVESILIQIHKLWLSEGAPPLGVPGSKIAANLPSSESVDLSAVLHELQRDGWIEYRARHWASIASGRPADLQDPQALGRQFVDQLEAAIEAEPDDVERSKLREAFAVGGSALRDVAVEVAGATLARSMGA